MKSRSSPRRLINHRSTPYRHDFNRLQAIHITSAPPNTIIVSAHLASLHPVDKQLGAPDNVAHGTNLRVEFNHATQSDIESVDILPTG